MVGLNDAEQSLVGDGQRPQDPKSHGPTITPPAARPQARSVVILGRMTWPGWPHTGTPAGRCLHRSAGYTPAGSTPMRHIKRSPSTLNNQEDPPPQQPTARPYCNKPQGTLHNG
jgi:hypothetical protein